MNQGMVHVVLQYSGAGHSTGHKGVVIKITGCVALPEVNRVVVSDI